MFVQPVDVLKITSDLGSVFGNRDHLETDYDNITLDRRNIVVAICTLDLKTAGYLSDLI